MLISGFFGMEMLKRKTRLVFTQTVTLAI